MSSQRSHQKTDVVFRVRVSYEYGGQKLYGPYATLGAARQRRTTWVNGALGRAADMAVVEKSSQTWEVVPNE